MAELVARPHPPGAHPVVVIGSGPGGLQVSYFLRRLGIAHAVLSEDDAPGGMFRRWPHFQRLITWTKPFAPEPRSSRFYERYDWNSLLAEEEPHRGLTATFMDDSSYFPRRAAVEQSLAAFADRTAVSVRYGCRWVATRREDDHFVVETTEGAYRARALVVATGVTDPYRPDIPGLADVPHYAEVKPLEAYRDKRVVLIGKRNSGFELADGLLPFARRIVLVSPRPARFAIHTRTIAGVRARYIQPYEDHLLRGGVSCLDGAIERVERRGATYRVTVRPSSGAPVLDLEADEVIAATGFRGRIGDLAALGVRTFTHLNLPAQTAFWESVTVPGVYFAGSLTQGSLGLRKHGVPSASASLHGFRYNARILARHIAERLGATPPERTVAPTDLVRWLLDELTRAPELWLQRSYLARVVSVAADGPRDHGILPLQHFVDDAGGPDGAAVAIELNAEGQSYPAVYVRHRGDVSEHLLEPNELLDFRTDRYVRELTGALEPLGIPALPDGGAGEPMVNRRPAT